MSYPDWVPMWLRTAMDRKCADLAELAVPVTMVVDGQERFTLAAFGPIAWRVPDGCGDPKGVTTVVRVKRDRPFDFVACKHRPNARALLYQSSDGLVYPTGAESFDARCMDAVVAQFPKARWSLPFVAQYLCAFDGEPAEDLENLVAIVRSHGKHFDVKSKKRAEPTGVDVSALPVMYDVSCLAKPPTLTATWFGPMASFDVVEPQFRPKPGQVFMVAGTHWKASERDDQNNSTWIMAHLVSRVAPHGAILEIEHVERSIEEIATEMRFAQIRKAERARISREEAESIRGTIATSALSGAIGKASPIGPGTVSPAERDAKAPPSIMVSLPKASPGESFMLKWSAEAGALLTNASGQSVGSIEEVSSPLCVRDGAKADDGPLPELGPDDISEWRILGSSEMMLRVHRYPTLQHVSIWSSRHNLSVCGVGVVAIQVTAADGAAIGVHIDLETSGESLTRALEKLALIAGNCPNRSDALAEIVSSMKKLQYFGSRVVTECDWTRVEEL